MGSSGTGPGSAPAAVESAHNASMGAKRYKNVAQAALEEMVAKGFPREELSVRRVKGDRS
jgi:hypothetical protein